MPIFQYSLCYSRNNHVVGYLESIGVYRSIFTLGMMICSDFVPLVNSYKPPVGVQVELCQSQEGMWWKSSDENALRHWKYVFDVSSGKTRKSKVINNY